MCVTKRQVTGPTSDSGGGSGGGGPTPGNSGRKLLRKLLEGAALDQAAAGGQGDIAAKEQALADKQAAALQAAKPEDIFLASYQNCECPTSAIAVSMLAAGAYLGNHFCLLYSLWRRAGMATPHSDSPQNRLPAPDRDDPPSTACA